jgi:predicted DNA binding protein
MRKVTVVLDTRSVTAFGPEGFFENIERIEGRQLVRFDPKEGVKVAIADFVMRPGHKPSEIPWPKGARIVDVIGQDGDRYTCILKVIAEGWMLKLTALFDLDVIYLPNMYADRESIVFSFVSDDDRLRKLVATVKLLGVVKDVHMSEFALPDTGALSELTEKQREVITKARQLGYYDVPRRATTKQVAEALGISKATAVEHIRKAERRLIEHVLSGA